MCQIKTEDDIQPYNVIIMHSVCVWKICKWIETSDNYLANKMHLAWWICSSWSTKCRHWSRRWLSPAWRSHALLDSKAACSSHNHLWTNNLEILGWPDNTLKSIKNTPPYYAMFTVLSQTKDVSLAGCKSKFYDTSPDSYVYIACGYFCLYDVRKCDLIKN